MATAAEDAFRHALEVARSRGFAEVELEAEDSSFQARLAPVPAAYAVHQVPSPNEPVALKEPQKAEITAPLVGYYQPVTPPLVEGQYVTKGQIVGVIAALGLANDIESSFNGEIVKVYVEEGQSVEYGQTIAEVKPR